MKKCICFSSCLFLLSLGCNHSPSQRNIEKYSSGLPATSKPPEPIITKAIGIKIKAGKPVVVPAGKPHRTQIENNITIAGKPVIINLDSVVVNTPGKYHFSLPETSPALLTYRQAGIPQVVVAGKPGSKDANPGNFVSYGMLQGLRSNEYLCVLRDRKGNIWFGSNGDGVAKFDGKNFTNYTINEGLVQNFIQCMLEDRQGNIWFGVWSGGISKFDGKSFSTYTHTSGLRSNWVSCLAEDQQGNIWIGTNGSGLSKFDGKNFTQFTSKQGLDDDIVVDLLIDKSGKLWIATSKGLSNYDGSSFYHYSFLKQSKEGVQTLFEDDGGNIWMGTVHSGVFRYDRKQIIAYTTRQGLCSNAIMSIAQDRKGNIWFGSPDSGVCRFDSKYFVSYPEKQGFPHREVWDMLDDSSGNIWFATNGGGMLKWNSKNFSNLTSKEGLSNSNVRNILKDSKGNLWFATQGNGADKFDGKSFSNYSENTGVIFRLVWTMMEDHKKNIWFGTLQGVSMFDGKSFFNYTEQQGLVSSNVMTICETRKGDIWFGNIGGVTKFDGDSFTRYTDRNSLGVDFNLCLSIFEDSKDNIWFGSGGAGVVKFDGTNFTSYNEKNGLAHNVVRCIIEDLDGNYWFGTANGINKFDGQKFTRFSEANGLGNNDISSGKMDKYGNLWFGTPSGLSKLSREKLTEIAGGKLTNIAAQHLFYNYGYEEGFLGVGVHFGNTICEVSDSMFWVAAEDRVTSFNPLIETIDSTAPNVQLTDITLFDIDMPWQSLSKVKDSIIVLDNGTVIKDYRFDSITQWYGIPNGLSLAYDNNYLDFRYIGIVLTSAGKTRYQYKLDGFDKKWSGITAKTEASYPNLPAGNFVFKVKAVNADGYWSKEYEYPFRIRPPWWKTPWFVVAFVGLILTAGYFIIRGRIAQKFRRRLEQATQQKQIATYERKAIELEMQALRAQMNPHFFFNCLNSINMFLLENNKQAASEYLSKFSRLVRLILQNSPENRIPLCRELEALELYLNLESLRFENGFDYSIHLDESVDANDIAVPPLIIQPFAENAIWHGLMHKNEKGKLDIYVWIDADKLLYRIIDNGIGRKKAEELNRKSALHHRSMGMRITADRIALLKKEDSVPAIKITDLTDADNQPAGTEVLIKIPIANV